MVIFYFPKFKILENEFQREPRPLEYPIPH